MYFLYQYKNTNSKLMLKMFILSDQESPQKVPNTAKAAKIYRIQFIQSSFLYLE